MEQYILSGINVCILLCSVYCIIARFLTVLEIFGVAQLDMSTGVLLTDSIR